MDLRARLGPRYKGLDFRARSSGFGVWSRSSAVDTGLGGRGRARQEPGPGRTTDRGVSESLVAPGGERTTEVQETIIVDTGANFNLF